MSRKPIFLTIPASAWNDTRGDGSHLLATLVINGTSHHLEAIRIVYDERRNQIAASPEFEDALDGIFRIGGEDTFNTVKIFHRRYVLVVIPFP